MKSVLMMTVSCLLLAGCSTWAPYDPEDPAQRRQQEIKSCREDPYQDKCEPGAISPG